MCISFKNLASSALLFLIFNLYAVGTQAQTRFSPEKIKSIDAMINAQMPQVHIPGLAYALIENGEIVHTKGFGTADSNGTPVTTKTAFNIGSLTKSFTAMSTLKARENGLLDLDAPVVQYLPDFHTKDKTLSGKITVRHLLNHTSGLSTYTGNLDHLEKYEGTDALFRAIAKLKSAKLHAAPGEAFQYSNANYQALGALLEHIWGMPYADIINQQIIDPLFLADSFVRTPTSLQKPSQIHIAEPHRIWFNQARYYNWDMSTETVAQGGVFASAPDMANYLIEYMRDEPRLLSKDSIAEMSVLPDGSLLKGYGLGWQIKKNYSNDTHQTYIYHSGLAPGYSALAGFIAEDKTGFVILTNASPGFVSGNISAMKFGLADFILGNPAKHSLASPKINLFLLIVIFALPILIGIWAIALLKKHRHGRLVKRVGLVRILTPTAMLLGLAWAFSIAIPKANGASLATLRLFNPDIGLALTLGAYTCAIYAVLRFGLLIIRK